MEVDLGRDRTDRAGDGHVVVAVEVGVDATLEADLRGPAVDGLDHASLDLFEVEEVRSAAEVE